jgi:hypothetical protein
MMARTGFGRRVLLPLAIAVVAGCGSSGGANSPSTGPDANSDTFTVGASGETHKLALSKGGTLAFAFPAAAAGKSVTLREVTPASLGLDGQLDAVIEMLPRGETFGAPVLVTGNWPGAAPALVTFDSAGTFDAREPLLLASDGRSNALPHFAYLGITGAGSASGCPNGTLEMTTSSTDSTTCCSTGGNSVTWTCTQPAACRAIVTWPYETCTEGANRCAALFTASYSAVKDTCMDGGVEGGAPDAAADGGTSDASDAGDARSDASDASDGAATDAGPSGETCAAPIVIVALPFTDTVDLGLKDNDLVVNSKIANACAQMSDDGGGVSVLGGDKTGDVVYAYTPTTSGTVRVSILADGSDANRTALLTVTPNCESPNAACLANTKTDPAMGNKRVFDVSLEAGKSYFFIVDGAGDLPPVATLSIMP